MRPTRDDNLNALFEVLHDINDTQIDRLTSYAYKLYGDKRYKKRNEIKRTN